MLKAFIASVTFTAVVFASTSKISGLGTVLVERPNIVIHGAYLGKVEVWTVPTGTGITPDEFKRLGNAKRNTLPGRKEIWKYRIPDCNSVTSVTDVFVKAFDLHGRLVGKKSLPYSGASAVYQALCSSH